jgi:hypothetical protein
MNPTENALRQSAELARQIYEEMGVDFDKIEFENQFEESMRGSYVSKMCWTTEQAIRLKFPHIQNLDVSMNDEGLSSIIFDETDESPTQKEVLDFLVELKKGGTNIAP